MAIGLIIIGDEILSGKRTDRHLPKVIELVAARGLALAWAHYVGDDRERITEVLRRAFAGGDLVFSCGGIGATPDDHTRQSAAAAAGRALAVHPEGLKELEARFGAEINERRLRMIEFPEGSAIVPNPYNRIPGFSLNAHFFLPGFPEMAHPMMAWVLDTKYAHLRPEVRAVEDGILVRVGESFLIDIMNVVVRDYPELKLSSLPQNVEGGYQVELSVRGDPARVPAAMAYVRAEVARRGYDFSERPSGR